MKNNIIKYHSYAYEVKRKKIKNINFEIYEHYAVVRVTYRGSFYPEFVMNIPNKNKKIDVKLFDKVYTSITKVNKKLLKEE